MSLWLVPPDQWCPSTLCGRYGSSSALISLTSSLSASAARASSRWCGFDAPTIGAVTPGWCKSHASATCAFDTPRFRATSLTRSTLMPELPTVAESGIPGFEVIVWYGTLAPAATPAAIITRLNAEIRKMADMQNVKDQLALQGAEVMTSTPAALMQRMRDDREKWGRIVKLSGAKAD